MRFLFGFATVGLAALVAGAVGCANNSSATSPAKGQQPSTAQSSAGENQPASTAAADAAVTVKPVTWDGFQQTIKGLKGKVVVVDFWQTT